MAHYDVHRNRGHDGYDIKEPIYGGRPAAAVAFSATSESYMASSEQVVTYGDHTTRPDLHDQFWPRSSTRPQLIKRDEYDHSPRFGHANGSPRDSPRKTFHGTNSPPAGHFSSVYAPHLDSPRKNFRDDHPGVHGARLHSPQDSPKKNFRDERYGPHRGGAHNSPRKNFRDGHGGRFSSDDDSSDEEEVECRDGVCYPKPKHGGGYEYDKEKKKPNGYGAGNYPLQHYADHPPKRDPHHQASNAEKLPHTYGAHSYNAPAYTKPTSDAYYDRYADNDRNRNSYTHSINEPYAVPAPIKTRPDRGESSPISAVAQWTPFAPTSPRKGKADKIDSTEAQRRYGNAPPQSAGANRKYGAAIDSETAARKYGGVFVK